MGMVNFELIQIDHHQTNLKSEKRIDQMQQEAYQDHLRYVKSKRRDKLIDPSIIKFNSTKNAELLLNLNRSDCNEMNASNGQSSTKTFKQKPRRKIKHKAIRVTVSILVFITIPTYSNQHISQSSRAKS